MELYISINIKKEVTRGNIKTWNSRKEKLLSINENEEKYMDKD